ncbi:DUF6531 domain-containing protein, partial [Paenibacillus wulumuqiensis]|uniref:DUF6531 domain-containing protein n=1 Tax=Paenibacillus wulumuqiensis TaxID=1567107 RepID=UPI001F227841
MINSSPADFYYTVPVNGSVQAVNKSDKNQYVYSDGDGAYEFIIYDEDGSIASSGSTTMLSKFVKPGQRFVMTNTSSAPVTVSGANYAFYTSTQVEKPMVTKTLSPGSSIKVKNISGDQIKLLMSGLYEHAEYDASGDVAEYDDGSTLGNYVLPIGHTTVITNPSGSSSITVKIPKEAAIISDSSNPALYKYNVAPGASLEASNLTHSYATIQTNARYDYAFYDNAGIIDYGADRLTYNFKFNGSEKVAFTNVGLTTDLIYAPYEAFRFSIRTEPITFRRTLEPGQTLKAINTARSGFQVAADDQHHYVIYDQTTNKVDSFGNPIKADTHLVTKDEKIITTNSGLRPMVVSGPADAFALSSRSEPALYKGYLNVGESLKLFNESPGTFNLYTEGTYDQASYYADNSLRSLDHDRTLGSLPFHTGERVTVTNSGSTQFVLLSPYDVTRVQASPNPALIIKQLAIDQSAEFVNKAASTETVYFTGQHDLMDYDTAGNPDTYVRRSNVGARTVTAGQKLAVMNTDKNPIDAYGAYELFAASNRSTPVTFRKTLNNGQSMDFTNGATKPFSLYPAGTYDLAEYKGDEAVDVQREETLANQIIPVQNRISITNAAAPALIVEGPYDVFKVGARTNPALFEYNLAPRQSVEAEYTGGGGSGDVHLTAPYDYSLFVNNALDQYGRDISASSKREVSNGERLAVMNRSEQPSVAYGAYDVFKVTARTQPVTFRQVLNNGQSVDIKNTQGKAFNLYSVGGNYDYVGRKADGKVDQLALATDKAIQIQQTGEKMAITGNSSSPTIIEGAYDAFTVTNRANPALIKPTLKPGQSVDAVNVDSVDSVLRMTDTYDLAVYNTDGSLKQYLNTISSIPTQTIDVGAKVGLQNSDTSDIIVYGPFESFKITDRTRPVTLVRTLSPDETLVFQQNALDMMYLYVNGTYDFAQYKNNGEVKEFQTNYTIATQSSARNDRFVIAAAPDQKVTVAVSNDAFTIKATDTKPVTVKMLEVGENYSFRNISPGMFNPRVNGTHAYQIYNASGSLTSSNSSTTLPQHSLSASSRLVVTNVDAGPISVSAPTEAIRVTQGNDLLLKSLASGQSMKAANTSSGTARLTVDGKYDVAVYDASGQPISYDRLTTGASVAVPSGGYAILTGRQAAATTVNGNKENFVFEDTDRTALSIYNLDKDKMLKSLNVTDKAHTLMVDGSFTYWIEQGKEQTGASPLNIGAGNTAIIRNTSGKTVEVYSPYGLFRWEETTDPVIPVPVTPPTGQPVSSLDPSNYDPQTFYADPIDTSTGAQIINKTMLYAHGSIDIPFQAQYYSLLQGNGAMGKGWSHNYAISLKKDNKDGSLKIYWNDFRYNTFAKNSDGTYTSAEQSARNDHLQQNTNSSYTLTRYDGTTYEFSANGIIQSMRNSGGIEMTFQYDGSGRLASVTEPTTGAKLQLAYNAAGKVSSVADQAGRTSTFTYDDTGRLITLTDPAGNESKYTYNGNHQIVTGALNSKQLFMNSYDSKGRILKQTDGIEGHQTTLAYSEADHLFTTTITDRNGNIQKRVHDANHQLVQVLDALEGKTTYTYDDKGNRTSITNALNQTARFEYDDRGNVIQVTDPSGQSITMTYDNRGDLLKATGPDGSSITSTYDSSRRLLSTTDTEGNTIRYTYNDKGMLVSATDPRGGQIKYDYDGSRLTGVTQSTGEITTIGYDAAGRMTSQTDADGNTSKIVYNDNDQLVAVMDALGHKNSYTYDGHDNLTSVTDALGNITRYAYDNNAQLTGVTNALGGKISIQYDAEGRMTGVTDPLGRKTTFAYDKAGHLLSETNAQGASIRYSYDALSRPIEAYDALNNKMYTVQYDTAGNPVKLTDALGNTYTSTYNQLNQLTQSVDPLGRKTSYSYDKRNQLTDVNDAIQGHTSQAADAFGQITQMVDANGNQAQYQYDLLGRLTNEKDAAGGSHTYTYNKLGLLSQETDKNGRDTKYMYDAAGNLIQFADQAGSVAYQYDANGNILSVTGSDGKVLRRTFDALNRVETYTDGDGNTIGYSYDAAGQLITLTYPDGKKVHYTYDNAGHMSTVTDWNGRKTSYGYDANGRLTSTTRPDGTKETRSYNAAGQMTSKTDLNPDGSVLTESSYTYDAAGNMTQEEGGEVQNPLNSVTYDVYGPGLSPELEDVMIQSGMAEPTADRNDSVQTDVYSAPAATKDPSLTSWAAGMEAESLTLTEDVYGLYGDLQMTYTADNRLATVNGQAVTYDAEGNMLSGPLHGSMQDYRYDARNRLIQAGGVSYSYDNENNRNAITVNGVTTKQIINPHAVLSQVLMETDNAGTPQAWYVYGMGLIGREDAAGNYQTYHYDLRGSTIALTDAQGQVTDT